MTKQLLFIFLACITSVVVAQPRESVEGVHYQALPALVPTETEEDVIEVRELFWYGCPECFTLEPLTTDYREGVRGDVKMVRMPVIWNDIMATHARIYYTAVAVEGLRSSSGLRTNTCSWMRVWPSWSAVTSPVNVGTVRVIWCSLGGA